jgi:PhzF family phenazine biosynthesis protein
MQRRFVQLDVFTDRPYFGNPLAVVVDAEGLDTDEMQRFANWTNLSETTFLLPPTDPAADYRVRIFTPVAELPFAGHPTLGSAHAWLANGGVPRREGVVVQECGAGLVTIRRDGDALAFAAPALLRGGPVDEATLQQAVAELGIERSAVVDAAWADNGPGWLGLLLASADEVLAIRPNAMQLTIGVAGAYPAGSPFAYEVRAFYSDGGLTLEDPVTGSLNASLAQWLIATGRVTPPYTASQGTVLGRAGKVRITTDDTGTVWVGGDVTTCITGTVEV